MFAAERKESCAMKEIDRRCLNFMWHIWEKLQHIPLFWFLVWWLFLLLFWGFSVGLVWNFLFLFFGAVGNQIDKIPWLAKSRFTDSYH